MLEAPLEKWRVFLHPSQDDWSAGPSTARPEFWEGPGRARRSWRCTGLATWRRRCSPTPSDRILFTTYTANLAENIEATLKTFCGPERERIEVVHLHAWAVRFLRNQGHDKDIASPDEIESCWKEAVASSGVTEFDPAFLRKEWEAVVLANGIETLDAYLKVPRLGRGKTLSRPQRGQLWVVFQRYRQALDRRHRLDWLSLIRQVRLLLESGQTKPPYRAVVVDEAQDFHPEEWRLIRALAPQEANDLFVVGDAHQRIYGQKVSLSRCGISIQGRSSLLRINYRTTEQIRAWAMSILQGVEVDDLDGQRDDARGYRSLLTGPEPEVHHFASRNEEREFLAAFLKDLTQKRKAEDICLVARTNSLIKEEYVSILKNHGIPHQVLDKGKEKEGGGVRLATMHRVKGLEFPVMILAGINSKTMPVRVSSLEDDLAALAEHEERERALLFVAATRARDRLIVTGWGTRSPFLRDDHE